MQNRNETLYKQTTYKKACAEPNFMRISEHSEGKCRGRSKSWVEYLPPAPATVSLHAPKRIISTFIQALFSVRGQNVFAVNAFCTVETLFAVHCRAVNNAINKKVIWKYVRYRAFLKKCCTLSGQTLGHSSSGLCYRNIVMSQNVQKVMSENFETPN